VLYRTLMFLSWLACRTPRPVPPGAPWPSLREPRSNGDDDGGETVHATPQHSAEDRHVLGPLADEPGGDRAVSTRSASTAGHQCPKTAGLLKAPMPCLERF